MLRDLHGQEAFKRGLIRPIFRGLLIFKKNSLTEMGCRENVYSLDSNTRLSKLSNEHMNVKNNRTENAARTGDHAMCMCCGMSARPEGGAVRYC